MNLREEAHTYLIDRGCRSFTKKYLAYTVEKMLVEFFEKTTTKLENNSSTLSKGKYTDKEFERIISYNFESD